MDIKSQIREAALKNGMDMCGFASIDRFDKGPEDRHPSKILPGCKTVIVLGVRLLDGIVQANFRTFEDGREDLKGLWGTYGYAMLPNFAMTYACYAVAQVVERSTGEAATPLSTGPMTNGMQISIRHSAVAAGLGEFGWLHIVLSPQFGPRNRFGVILTTAEIEPDPMYSGPALCDPSKCSICTDCCPTNAIGLYSADDSLSCTIGDRSFKYAKLDVSRCQTATEGLRKSVGGKEDLVTTDDPTPKDIEDARAKLPISVTGLQHTETWHCGRCQSYCPVGNWKEKYFDREFSGGITNIR